MNAELRGNYRLGEFTLDAQRRQLLCADEPVKLAHQPFEVLLYLIEQRDRLVTRAELLERFWAGRDVYDVALSKCVGRIRKALGDQLDQPRFIETRWAEGYRYIGPLEDLPIPATIVTERVRVSRVVIEEELPDPEPTIVAAPVVDVVPAPTVQRPRQRWPWPRVAALALALVVVSSAALLLYRNSKDAGNSSAAPLNSIAVLPLKNLSGDAAQDFLGDGVAESLISALARAKGLKVIARTSTFAFKNRDTDVREIGRQLGVAAVLEGSLRRNAAQWRIEIRLVNTADGQVIWADELKPQSTGDLLKLQDEIACSVANNLRLLLCNEPEQALARRQTRNPAAYQAYLQGRYHWYRRTPDDMRQAQIAFEEALKADPQYALAYCGLAETHGIMQVNRQVPPNSVVTKTKAYAQKALELDPTLARPYAILGLLAGFVEWDWAASERLLQRARELDPGYAYALGWYANTLQAQGRLAEAETVLRQAIELDPLSLSLHNSLGENYYYAGQSERLLEQAQTLAARDPQNQNAQHLFFQYYIAKGDYAEAARRLEQGEMSSGAQIHYLWSVGKKTEAAQRLTELAGSAQGERHPFGVALGYAVLGDKDGAFRWLQRAYEQRDADLVSLKVEPALAGLRTEARFRELLRRVGLPE